MTPSREQIADLPAGGLPPPVTAYVAATNAFDADALVACFAPGALVNDQLRDFLGTSAIRGWAEREIVGGKMTMQVVNAAEHFGEVILTANVDGEFDKAGLPGVLTLTFHFSMHSDKIVRLFILNKRPVDSPPEIRTLQSAVLTRRPPDAAPQA
ncbi:nuclear transport factor 2 family protein [Variovorax sp. J22R115]|uniref:nuclear transport factor 2 family protein n=1 Tax=Variovorax sp. J22R115 TaxID=3053509 RepID=UPI00257860EB|nr:nuclear transport factor 2 family protein [Variovorax sp. J22R115]MDM0049894.1 nuclear transport factor 2 family protein [Variovorax sp. J22R115]